MHEELFAAMRQSVIDGDPDEVRVLAQRALALGIDPLEAINRGFVPGVTHVGEQFGLGEMFLPDLVLGGEAMKAAVAVLEPELARRGAQRESLGTVVLGTVRGDIHEIGKTLVQTMLSASGFQVHDLGVDVPVERFVGAVRELKPHVVGMSALLTTTMPGQRLVIEALEREGLRQQVKVIVGGAPVSQGWATEIGADGYGEDAMRAVTLVKALLGREAPAA
ncbi:MAG: corrinoid protein [Gemmatimonadetes bacterium]|jgi:corrinoid protein of di/trimethylamine methyltransferase|nr:corrinoid protein [Gemmatimonadota bacterium]MBK7784196.1 corrinoid protein [Gemmatimonadota bacterium]MBK7925125.1 corrinoid protein [Gemmatimonadota bacterium]MBK9067758.1 corrinoid protein [Gemmatimonadota bacterium]MBP9201014.1 corrinoid protein [Gemmatimonadales bacterium]